LRAKERRSRVGSPEGLWISRRGGLVVDDGKVVVRGERVVLDYGDVDAEVGALTEGAGLIDMGGRHRIWVRGADHVPFLQRMLTQDVQGMGLESAAPAAMCTAQGRIIGLGLLVGYPDSLLFDIPAVHGQGLVEALERYTLFDEVELTDCSQEMGHLHLEGPRAEAIVQDLAEGALSLAEGAYASTRLTIAGVTVAAVRHSRAGLSGFDFFLEADEVESVARRVVEAGSIWVGQTAFERVRVDSGVPVAGAELTEDVIPLEAGLDHFVSYTKGCYVGQEVIAKIKYLGQSPRTLMGIRGVGQSPAAGDELFSGARRVGYVTSVGEGVALGFVRTRIAAAGTRLSLGGKEGAEVVLESLPLMEGRINHRCAIGEVTTV